jgi:hypothetical protein
MALQHGVRTTYVKHKCRCAECTRANTEYRRDVDRQHKAETVDGSNGRPYVLGREHGTTATYLRHCRCDECCAAYAVKNADQKTRRREA